MATNVETFENPRDNLPNAYAGTGGVNPVTAREIDFVSRFNNNWDALREILGIMNPVRKAPGTQLVSYTAKVDLEDGDIEPGAVIPYSKATIQQFVKDDVDIKKYARGVPIEDVEKYGAAIAVQRADEAFLNELQDKVLGDFYDFLTDDTAASKSTEATFQMAVAIAIGTVTDKFKKMHKNANDIVVFVNTMDAYRYLGAADLTVQSAFGMQYIQNFMGARTIILSSEIESGKVIALPSDNIVLYYVDPGDSEFVLLGLDYTVSGDTNLIGFHANGNYSTATGESYALMGLKLWAEYADGIAIITVDNATEGTEETEGTT